MRYAPATLFASMLALACLVASPGPVESAEAFLHARAAEAAARGDRAEVERALRGWATLASSDRLPRGLEDDAAAALAWAERAGRLRLFASRLEGRIRAGVRDPASIADRIDAFATVRGERIRIARTDEDTGDRVEYRVGADVAVLLEAVMTRYGREVVLARVELLPSAPAAPPKAPELAAPARAEPGDGERDADEEGLAWWMIAGGVLAAALAGAAVWQETRF